MYTKEEQAENRAKLVEALRSGKYKQGRRQLRISADGTYCCLGVACDIAPFGEWENNMFIDDKGNKELAELTNRVKDWLGFAYPGGHLIDDIVLGGYRSLAYANDSGRTFEEIADAIERGEVRQQR